MLTRGVSLWLWAIACPLASATLGDSIVASDALSSLWKDVPRSLATVSKSAHDTCAKAHDVSALPYGAASSVSPTGRSGLGGGSESCHQLSSDGRVQWWSLLGTGTCVEVLVWAPFSIYIGVNEGTSCTDLTCVLESNYGTGSLKFKAEEGETYKIAIGASDAGSLGDFAVAFLVRPDPALCRLFSVYLLLMIVFIRMLKIVQKHLLMRNALLLLKCQSSPTKSRETMLFLSQSSTLPLSHAHSFTPMPIHFGGRLCQYLIRV
jgi:hypothetical protein